eukprot:1953299-Rhodomonas_salina.1
MAMDPQQRVALEVAYEAMLKADLAPERLRGRSVGTFVTAGTSDFKDVGFDAKRISPYSGTGASSAISSNRLAHTFGLTGPSMTIDTACSSSLVAMDAACKA